MLLTDNDVWLRVRSILPRSLPSPPCTEAEEAEEGEEEGEEGAEGGAEEGVGEGGGDAEFPIITLRGGIATQEGGFWGSPLEEEKTGVAAGGGGGDVDNRNPKLPSTKEGYRGGGGPRVTTTSSMH